MAYDDTLAELIRKQFLSRKVRTEEKKMMGGLTFMVKGKMCVGILKDELMVRIDPTDHDEALKRTGCREMDFTGRPMRGFVFVGPKGIQRDLSYWIDSALAYNSAAKASKKKMKKTAAKTAKRVTQNIGKKRKKKSGSPKL